jgi:alanyl-tRNA synthetase
VTVPKTEKLYLDDPYSTVFESAVAGVEEDAEALVVTLDRSLFYPDSGGQLSDRGKLAGLEVIDVTEDDSGVVYHRLQRPSPQATLKTKRVEGLVDWDRRFDHMQQHTGQHVLSRAFIQAGGLYTVSFHMGDDSCTIDLEGQGFDDNVARRAEAIANSIVVANRAVTVKTVPVEQVDRAELRRSIPEGVTDARIVTVEGFDDIPCCGTHVARTGELGVIKVLKSENVRGNQRVYFKVGGRAFADYVEKHDILQNLSNRLTTAPSDIAAKVEKLGAENQRFKKDTRRLSNRLAALEKGAVVAGAVETAGVRLVVHYSTAAVDCDSRGT